MDLFELRDGRAYPSVHALIIEPYKSLWEKDDSVQHVECIKLFTYVELLCSPKKSNPYFGLDERLRPPKLKKDIWGDENYVHPLYSINEIVGAIHKYIEFLEISVPGYGALLSAIKAAQTVKEFLDTVDFDERTKSGGMVIKPKDVTGAIVDIPDIIKNLRIAREEVHQGLTDAAKTRNQREIGYFER